MPLEKGSSKKAISDNIATERRAGKSAKQAEAIAYSVAGEDQAPAAGIMFVCNGRVLLMNRADGSGWGFGGGSIEPNEDAETAARREALEETGIAWDGDLQDMGQYGNFRMYRADVPEEVKPQLNGEHTDYGWFGRDDMPEELFDDNDSILNDAFAQDDRDSAREYDVNGWFEVEDNPISLVGVFPYRASNIPQEKARGNLDGIVMVLRPEAELNNPATLQSLRLTPWIIDHTMLGDGTKNTVTTDSVGVRGVIGENVWFDPALGDYGGIRANIKCFSEILDQRIENGQVPLSLGYRCIYEYSPGVFNGAPYNYIQRYIRGNHLATVKDGRMGEIVAVMDGFSNEPVKVIAMPKAIPPVKGKKVRKVRLTQNALDFLRSKLDALGLDADDTAGESEDKAGAMKQAAELIAQIKPLMQALADLQAVGTEPVEAEVEDEESDDPKRTNTTGKPGTEPAGARGDDGNGLVSKPTRAAGEGEDEDDKDKKETEAMDAAVARSLERMGIARGTGLDMSDVYVDINKRNTLAARLSEFVGAFDHSEMTAQEVAAYGVKKLGLTGIPQGGEMLAVQSYLHGRPAPRKTKAYATTAPVAAMDSADSGAAPTWLATQLANKD